MFKVLDLFSGAGGFSLGFKMGGGNVTTHLEIDEYASNTIKANFHNSTVITEDIRFVDVSKFKNENFDVIIGGPPCQGFSVAGSSQFGIQDDRNELVFWYLKYVQTLKPKIAIIENVPNVLTKKSKDGKSFLSIVKSIASEMNFDVAYNVLNAMNYGVPQARKRAFIVLHLKGTKFTFPEITHEEENKQTLFDSYEPVVTVGEALGDLPGDGNGTYLCDASNKFQKYCRSDTATISNHEPMKHTDRVVERFKVIQQGQSLKDVPFSYGQIAYGSGETVSKPFKYNNYRLDEKKPSLTIPASYQSLFVHPNHNRNLTAREGARLMSFPDSYVFTGPKTMMSWESGLSQYNQIGNAVCPLVAKALSKSVLSYLNEVKVEKSDVSTSKILDEISQKLKTHRYTIEDAKLGVCSTITSEQLDTNLLISSKYYDKEKSCFLVNKTEISSETINFTYNLLKNKKCEICNNHDAPFGEHDGWINLLISKSDLNSLISNKNDIGLDFHLRLFTKDDRRIANEVSVVLVDLNLAELVLERNPRTGKKVKTLKLIKRYKNTGL